MADDGKTPPPSKAALKAEATKVRTKLQQSIEAAEAEHKKELFLKRVELARVGVRNYEGHKLIGAVRSFQTYLRILEDAKGVPEGGLHPGLFDRRRDIPELLLINGIYWDLVKIYDRTQSEDKYREFMNYLEKFIVFTKGMPFEHISMESMRKYISSEKPVHKSQFKNAYRQMGGSLMCFVATELSDVTRPETVHELRAFRDGVLRRGRAGRAFIAWYYRNGPALARTVSRLPEPVRRGMGLCLDSLAALISIRPIDWPAKRAPDRLRGSYRARNRRT